MVCQQPWHINHVRQTGCIIPDTLVPQDHRVVIKHRETNNNYFTNWSVVTCAWNELIPRFKIAGSFNELTFIGTTQKSLWETDFSFCTGQIWVSISPACGHICTPTLSRFCHNLVRDDPGGGGRGKGETWEI